MGVSVHATALVAEGAQLGEDVVVGPYSIIGPHVEIGDRCSIAGHVVIEGHTSLGEETEVSPFACLGTPPQDLKFRGEPSTLVIGPRNRIREYVTLQPGTAHGTMTTIIGESNLFMACSHVAHDCRVGSRNIFANNVALAGHVEVGNNAIFGGMAGIHQFCRVGDFAILGAGSMVAADIPPYCIGQGDRCHLRGVNVIGLQRGGFTSDDVRVVRRAYRHLFSRVGHLSDKISSLAPEIAAHPAVQRLLGFLKSSERGIATPARALSTDE